jgi:hypothetical protein
MKLVSQGDSHELGGKTGAIGVPQGSVIREEADADENMTSCQARQ